MLKSESFIPSSNLEDFLAQARDHYEAAKAADEIDRKDAQEDQRFESGGLNQWDQVSIQARSEPGFERPILTENRLHVYCQQVVNDGRQSKPSITVAAMDGGDPKTAEIIQGRIRHIEYASDADVAYDHAREQQVVSGRGFYRITTEYEGEMSLRQVPRIKPIENQFSVLWDPSARCYNLSDANWMFVISYISKQQHERDYPNSVAQTNNWFAGRDYAPTWMMAGSDAEQVQIAEYWRKEPLPNRKLVQLASGKVHWADEIPDESINPASTTPAKITASRMVERFKVMQYVINGVEILEETEWPVPYIPIIPQWAREEWIDGVRHTVGLGRHAKDPQRLINLYVSNIAEQIAQLPKEPFVAAEGQIAGHEREWQEGANKPRVVRVYKPQAIGGTAVPPPQRNVAEPPIQALTLGLNQAIDALKASMGMFDQSLGAGPVEQSGIAIQRRVRQADNANFHFHDNEARSRKYAGTIILALMAVLDKGVQAWTIRTADGKTKRVPIGQAYRDEETGEQLQHDLSGMENAYDVAVTTGPSYSSARAESFEKLTTMAQAWPGLMPVAGDIVMRQADMPGADQLADRLEKALPPALQPAPKGRPIIPPQIQQAMGQAQATIKALSEVNNKLLDEREAKILDLQSRERIAAVQEDTKRFIAVLEGKLAEAKMGLDAGGRRLEAEIDVIQHSTEMVEARIEREMEAAQQAAAQQAGPAGAQSSPAPAPTTAPAASGGFFPPSTPAAAGAPTGA